MTGKKNSWFAILSLLVFSTCKPDFDEPKYTAGSADFTKYVAIGSFGTAGYADGALYLEAQQNSYPAILARQFAQVGGGVFKQPLTNPGVGIGVDPSGATFTSKFYLGYTTDCSGKTAMKPLFASSSADLSNVGGDIFNVHSIYSTSGPFNNFGIPGAKIYDFDEPDFGNSNIIVSKNPYYSRMASNPGTSTVVDDALITEPSFFTFWIGTQDVYSYAIKGGEGGDSITTVSYFNLEMNEHMDKLLAVSPSGAIANIPDISTLPYFKTIPYNGLLITRQTLVDSLNAVYTSSGITFQLGSNPFIISDPTNANGFRKIKSTEYVLLSVPSDSITCGGWGSFEFIPDKYVLRDVEISKINYAITSFNATIKSVATNRNLAFVDMNTFYKTLQSTGIVFNGVSFTTQFISGGAFSLDGVHFNARGAAMVANEFLKAINQKYNSTIPLADVNAYPGIKFP